MATKAHITVIGAGVIGLQVAKDLLASGYQVTVIAREFPSDTSINYTSPWAGAHFRPHSTAMDQRECAWDEATYRSWLSLISEEESNQVPEAERSGLAIRKSTLLWDDDPAAPAGLWFADKVRDFKVLESLPPGVASGASFSAIAINVPKYLAHLYSTIVDVGARIIRADLSPHGSLQDVLAESQALVASDSGADCRVFVNATGLGARSLCDDDKVHPVRGQTLLVRGELGDIRIRQGVDEKGIPYIAYAIPRPSSGTTILGGCNEKGSYDPNVDPTITSKIMARCQTLCPELLRPSGAFDIISAQVGLRPGREGGARLEPEDVAINGKHTTVIHAYGHGGAGFQNSVGVSRDVSALVTTSLLDFGA